MFAGTACMHHPFFEQDESSKVQKLLSGTPRVIMWLSTLLWDSVQYLLVYGTTHHDFKAGNYRASFVFPFLQCCNVSLSVQTPILTSVRR